MTIEEKYLIWLNHPNMDEELLEELKKMDAETKNDAFYKDSEFGTGGMRGLLGAGPNRLNVYTIRKATVGFANYLNKMKSNNSVAIGYDNRHNSKKFAFDCADTLSHFGIKTYVFESLRTTPETSYAVRHYGCDGGIMITASHNPKEYNGYKVYDNTGCQIVPAMLAGLLSEINALGNDLIDKFEGNKDLIQIIGKDCDEPYLKEVLTVQLNPNLDKKNFKLVYTPQHGTAYQSIKSLFNTVGYDCTYVTEQCFPSETFENTLVPNPEEPKAYVLALEYARKVNADIVLTTDPDGDRLGVAVKDGDDYTLMTGNQTAAVLLEYTFSQMKEKGIMPKNPVMFNTVVTSDLGEIISNYYGVETEKTLTGFKYIGEKVHKYEQTHEKNYVFGYEESYGYLIKEFVRDKDANQSCLLIAECANYYHKQGKSMMDVLRELWAKFGTFSETQQSIVLPGEDGAIKLKALLQGLREHTPKQIGGQKVIRYQDFGTQKEYQDGNETNLVGFDKSDVLKYFLEDGTWIAVRPSGTEPKCKIYYCIKGNSASDVSKKKDIYYQAMAELMK